MFSLIITIISIALVAALALATIYYGGDAFTKGGDAAKASQLINEGQQLQGALTLRSVQDPTAPALVAGAPSPLLAGYLSQLPADWVVNSTQTAFLSPKVSPAVCVEVNKKAGFETPATVKLADLSDKVYGCVNTTDADDPVADEDRVVTYKF